MLAKPISKQEEKDAQNMAGYLKDQEGEYAESEIMSEPEEEESVHPDEADIDDAEIANAQAGSSSALGYPSGKSSS